MGYGMLGIYESRNAGILQEGSGGVFFGSLTFVQNDPDFYTLLWADIRDLAIGAEVKE